MRDLLKPHDPVWLDVFEELRSSLVVVLGDTEIQIEHVGSTAIPGLPAKPILDLDIVISDLESLVSMESALVKIGYYARGNQGVPGRYAFRQSDSFVPRTEPPQSWMPHHLYVCFADSLALKNHLCFRDALLADPELVAEYARMKEELVHRPGMDRETYTRAKTAFILKVLAGAGFPADELAQIERANL
jgi:GrpB-like predicted nucleotidyltransferase (UPF0157 family)